HAVAYDPASDPMVRWAEPVLDRLSPEGVSVVLDAGCGTGRVTERLLERRSADDGSALVRAVAAALPELVVDDVTLDIVATRGGG
ncbi:MAG TPA: hypothetical protein VG078_02900, partial [Acidimicrobiales bacterium]|nr:hypothetical protein [Acidimicrobiales bacterium]